MAWKESWQLKLRRRIRKLFNKVFHRRRYFISRYRGADFLLRPDGIGTFEMSAKISEYPELTNFMRHCADLRPDVFIDIGANIGLYSCILLRNGSVARAVLFEPDRINLVHLRANLLINGVLDRTDVREIALGNAAGLQRLVPGKIDGGFSRIATDDGADEGYEVQVARLDDVVAFADRRLAVKIDVENYECQVLSGMMRTLRDNRCVVQIEAFENRRDQVMSIMADAGYRLALALSPNFVFENAGA